MKAPSAIASIASSESDGDENEVTRIQMKSGGGSMKDSQTIPSKQSAWFVTIRAHRVDDHVIIEPVHEYD